MKRPLAGTRQAQRAERIVRRHRLVRLHRLVIGIVATASFSCGTILAKATELAELIQPSSTPNSAAYSDFLTEVEVAIDATQSPLRLEDLQSVGLANHPAVERAAALVSAARGRALQAGLPPNLVTGIDFQQLGSDGLAEQYGVTIGQEFVPKQKLILSRCVELQEVRRLIQELAATRQRVLTDVRVAYFRTLRAQQQLDVVQDLVEIAEKGQTISSELFKAGEVGRADVLQAEVEFESAKLLLINAENRHRAAWRELGAVTGQSFLEPRTLAGSLGASHDDLDFAATLANIQATSPEIASLVAAIDRARVNLQRQRIEPLPNVYVDGLINWRDNGIGGRSDGGIAVTLPLPLWNRNQGGIHEARQQLFASERALSQMELAIQQRLAGVFEQYQNAHQQVSRYEETLLPKAQETLELTRETYQLGEVSFINLLTVQRTYAQYRLDYLDALESLRVAESQIEGLLLDNSLQVTQP